MKNLTILAVQAILDEGRRNCTYEFRCNLENYHYFSHYHRPHTTTDLQKDQKGSNVLNHDHPFNLERYDYSQVRHISRWEID